MKDFHKDWKMIQSLLYQEPLQKFLLEILISSSYYPKKGLFDFYSMPMKDIKVVIIEEEPNVFTSKINNEELIKQGIFKIYMSMTVEVGSDNSHLNYWKTFVLQTIMTLSFAHNCIWIVRKIDLGTAICYIKGNLFLVSNYNEETINEIPIGYMNYVLYNEKNDLHYCNVILKKMKLNQIKW